PASYGNYADDRRVDGMDFVAWQRSLGGASSAVDGDRSGVVDANDLNIWRANFGFAFPPLPDPPTGGPTGSGSGIGNIPPISFTPATHLAAAGETSVPSDRAAAIARPEPDEVRDAAFAQFAGPAPLVAIAPRRRAALPTPPADSTTAPLALELLGNPIPPGLSAQA
ncbi:MAG TPA: hypothetical protein VEQ85_06585, partial [Lacipirellulaceae bacterium]|nr:hypothetical protein [Lacipirellulaceae bacterium]